MGCFLDLHPPARATEAIAITLQKTAPAHILTTLILASGFAVCGLIPFLPVSRMGSLSLIAVLIALGGDLLVIPALLGRSRR
jgi:predicted RND superfamily exporter protein